MKAISHQRKALQVTQATPVLAWYMCVCVRSCVLRMMPRPRTTPDIKTSRPKPQQAIVPARSRKSTHFWEGKRQIKWHSSSLHTGDNRHLQITEIWVGDFSFLRRAQKAPVVISDRSLTRPILMCERKGPVLRPVTRACTVTVRNRDVREAAETICCAALLDRTEKWFT